MKTISIKCPNCGGNINLDLDNIQKTNNIISYGVVSSIREDLNKNIIISLYNGEIKVFQKIKDN